MDTSIAVVTHTYESTSQNALSITAGSTVEVLSSGNAEWWYIDYNGQKGYFPATCLERPPPETPLPPGWKKHISPDQRIYFYNEETGVSQWTAPAAPAAPPAPPPPPPRRVEVAKQSAEACTQRPVISHSSTVPSVSTPHISALSRSTSHPVVIAPSDLALLPAPTQPPPPPPKKPVDCAVSNPTSVAYSSTSAGCETAVHSAQKLPHPHSSSVENWAPPKPAAPYRRNRVDSDAEKPCAPTHATLLNVSAPSSTAVSPSSRPESYGSVSKRTSFNMAAMAKAVDTIVGHHTLPAELQHDISNFSITGYATDHFKKQKKWGLFGRKYIKPEQIVISYSKKYTTSLTVLSPANEKRALAMYALICSYMETEISISDRKFCEVTMEINRCMEAGMIDEVYCTLIKQTTDNPHERSMERGWELLCAASMICQPTNPLMRVVAGHSTNMRFMPNPTGALAMAVHSLLCGHLKHLEVGSEQPPILRVDELSLDEHIIPLKKFWLPEKSYGCRVEQVILHEVYHRNPDGVCPLYTELMYSRDAVPEILVLLCDYILANGGKSRSGIFREAADVDTVKAVMAQLEVGNYRSIMVPRVGAELSRRGSAPNLKGDAKRGGVGGRRSVSAPAMTRQGEFIPINDVLVACDLLKLWFRRMPEPITGFDLYSECVNVGRRDDPHAAELVLNKMPPLNWSVLKYLSTFLRELSLTSHLTNMEITNLSLVFAPNCIKSPSDDPRVFANNADDERRCFRLFVDILCPP